MRVPFLLLTPACVFLGAASVVAAGHGIDLVRLGVVLGGALLAHVSVNTLNEWSDFRSGLDLQTTRTPFSGGSGALPQQPAMHGAVLALAVAALAGTAVIGLYLLMVVGAGLLPLGLVGLLLIVTYTDWLNRLPLLCLIAPGTGFGLLMVPGSAYALAGEYHPVTWIAAAVPFFLVNNLLLLNQYPDIEADAAAGRRHLLIVHGPDAGIKAYGGFALGAALVIVGGWLIGSVAALGLLALAPLAIAGYVWQGLRRWQAGIGERPQFLAANVAVAIVTPIVLGIALIVQA